MRLAPSELMVLIAPGKMWGFDAVRADLAALVADGAFVARDCGILAAELVPGPRPDPGEYPAHVLALYDVLTSAAAGGAIAGQPAGGLVNPIERVLNAAWPGAGGTSYSMKMAGASLRERGLIGERQTSALFGLVKSTALARLPAAEGLGASIDRRVQASQGLGRVLRDDPATALAVACSLGNLLAAAGETQQYRYVSEGLMPRLAAAVATWAGPLPPVPPPYALQSGDEAWVELGPVPLSLSGLRALADAVAAVRRLNIAVHA